MARRLIDFLVLPAQMSAFEVSYLRRLNRIGLLFFALHLPVFIALAWLNDTNPLLALGLTLGVLVGPTIAYFTFENPRAISMTYGFSAMLMGGLLVHFGQGPVQIEMHFYFFALLAMLAVYANPLVIITAAVTVALHHLALWLIAPTSAFNYEAPLWVVLVHASFVVLESVATCFIARSFFDNVIGLEKIVETRTTELGARNDAMRLVLDHVQQGFLTIDRDTVMSSERSKVVEAWLGASSPNQTFPDYLARFAPRTAQAFKLGWDEVLADIMPLELTLAQLPERFTIEERDYRIEYEPMIGQQLERVLVVISDITSDVARERLEIEQREVMSILERLAVDKGGVLEFFEEASDQVAILREQRGPAGTQKRVIHTLKGNAMIFGVKSIARICERFEAHIEETGELPSVQDRELLVARWTNLCDSLQMLLGERKRQRIELEDEEYEEILAAVIRGDHGDLLAARIRSWRLEPTLKRLVRIGEQARALAQRTGRGNIAVEVYDNQLRLDSVSWAPFWAAFVHVVRNAVDHGLEPDGERAASKGRSAISLTTKLEGDELVIQLADNGRGVNWAKVAEKARERGLPHATRHDLVEALFADGLTTADEATAYSGRGVGMPAVRAACNARGGVVLVKDRPNGGTCMEFRFPYATERLPLRASA